MSTSQTQDIMKAATTLINGEYKTPGKLLLWAMAIGQWMFIIFFGGILLIGLLYIFLSAILSLVEGYQKNAASTKNNRVIQEKYIEKEFDKINNMTEFLELRENSTNERQSILKSLMKIIRSPINQKLDQEALEQRVKTLSLELTNCKISKEKYTDKLSKAIKYSEVPAASKEFNKIMGKLLVDEPPLEHHTTYSSQEGERWEALCLLCQDELDKAQSEVAQHLNETVNVQK
ncbi:MAG: hypothetical protein KBD36_05665 [Alphaproteobacteria bacterium]|nr:hypothetical protein [Alphaproteobacteria bacterium]MBP9777312.1 hypothetical protein [Alphaproteobacteria bacterium]